MSQPPARQGGKTGERPELPWVECYSRDVPMSLGNDATHAVSQGPYVALEPTSLCGLIRLGSQVPTGSRQKLAAVLANRLKSLLFV